MTDNIRQLNNIFANMDVSNNQEQDQFVHEIRNLILLYFKNDPKLRDFKLLIKLSEDTKQSSKMIYLGEQKSIFLNADIE